MNSERTDARGGPGLRGPGLRERVLYFQVAAAFVLLAACSSSTNGSDAGPATATCASPGGKVTGAADVHCAMNNVPVVQRTDMASCYADAAAGDDASSGDDAAVVVEDGGGPTGNCFPTLYGATMYGQAGADDDCKYDVAWSSTPVCEGGDGVSFTLSVHKRTDHSGVTGAAPYIEAVKDCSTPSAGSPRTTDVGNGQYTIGPIVFPAAGRWVVRFHVFGGGNCADTLPTSPHGHAAFFVDVP